MSIAAFPYSVAWVSRLLAEQSTPADVANFILVCVALIIFATAVVYVTAMRVLWRGLRHGSHSFGDVFFDRSHFREWAAERVIVALTTLLLIYTFAIRHSIVERIASQPAQRLMVEMAQRGLVGSTDTTGLIASGVGAEAILKPLVTAGDAADAFAIADHLIRWPGEDESAVQTAKWVLIIFAVLLLSGYIVWELSQRYGQLRAAYATGTEASPDYERTLKGVATIAICIALLLVAAAPMDEKGHLVDSVLSAMKSRTLEKRQDSALAQRVAETLGGAAARRGQSADSSLRRLSLAVEKVSGGLVALEHHVTRSDSVALEADTAFATALRSQFKSMSDQLLREASLLAPRVTTLEARADSGGIVMFADTAMRYAISLPGSKTALRSGAGTAFYRVAVGTYDIQLQGARTTATSRVTVHKGEVLIRCAAVERAPVVQAGDQVGRGNKVVPKILAVAPPKLIVTDLCRATGG